MTDTPLPGTSACALMFGAVAYLAVRQLRFERRLVGDTERVTSELVRAQHEWATDTVKAIEDAFRIGGGR